MRKRNGPADSLAEDVPVPEWVASAFPARHRFIDLDGHRLHFVDEGDGPPLLLLHGNPTWSFLYRHVTAGLRGHFRCIAPDYPGFGLSTAAPGYRHLPAEHAAVIRRFVEALDLQGVTLMVQDWGAQSAWRSPPALPTDFVPW